MKVGFAKVRRNYHELCRFLGVLLFVCLFVLIHKDSLNQDMVNIRAILWLFFSPSSSCSCKLHEPQWEHSHIFEEKEQK